VQSIRAADGAQWSAAHQYPMLPWSCIVLEAVPEEQVRVCSRRCDPCSPDMPAAHSHVSLY
jgi:hypothetical protein